MFETFDNIKQKIVLLTGGAGFIGSHIAETILKLGISKLIIIDNLCTGNLDNLKVTGVLDDHRVSFYQEDIENMDVLKEIVENEIGRMGKKIDIICHQAALGSVPRSISTPMASHKTNVDGFFNMLEIARLYNIKRFVYASSSSVYGDSETLPKIEENVGNVISPYAATKKINEIYANVFGYCYEIECVGLRYFNIFGPRQSINGPYAAVIPRFASAIFKRINPIIYGNGEQSRDFTYVENAVNANILAMTVPSISKSGNAICGRVYNIASGGRVNLNEMYQNMKKITGISLDPIYEESRKGDIEHSWASIKIATEMLGYYPTVPFLEGLKITLKYYESLT